MAFIDKLGGRKFFCVVIFLLAGLAVDLFTQRGLSQNLLQLFIFLAGIYTAGNGITKMSDALKSRKDEKNEQVVSMVQNLVTSTQQAVTTLHNTQQDVIKNQTVLHNAVSELLAPKR